MKLMGKVKKLQVDSLALTAVGMANQKVNSTEAGADNFE